MKNGQLKPDKTLEHYVKYNTFHKQASKKWKADITEVQNFSYNEDRDEYVCGYGRIYVQKKS